ncbi:MAG TPA: hypothetical protein VF715_16985 [Thermoleophilaceae bacterium]|jgi:hypothetical protein
MKPLHVRLAAWGTVLVLAVVAFNLRTGAADVDHGANGPQLNGRTSQGLPIWAVLDSDGQRVREIRMVWRVRCDGGNAIDPVGLVARASADGFRRRDGGFAFAQTREFDEGDGWTSRVRSRIDGSATSGTASVEVRFRQHDVEGFTCRSGPIRWSVRE